jgi:hypothetical protein
MSTSQLGSERTVVDGVRAHDHRRHAYRLFFAAAALLGVSVFLPWASVVGLVSLHLPARGIGVMLAFAGVYARIGRRVFVGRESRAAIAGAWVVNVLNCLGIAGVYMELGKTEGIVEPAIGVVVASLGALLAVAATVFLHRARKDTIAP